MYLVLSDDGRDGERDETGDDERRSRGHASNIGGPSKKMKRTFAVIIGAIDATAIARDTRFMPASLYRISFPAGFLPLVDRLVRRDFSEQSVVESDASSLTFQPSNPFKEVPYAQGISLIIDTVKATALEEAYRLFANRVRSGDARSELARVFRDKAFMRAGRAERFAVRGFAEGAPAFPGHGARAALEAAIESVVGTRADSERPDIELAVAVRGSGAAYLTAARRPATADERETAAGALPRSTARLLCELARPRADDVFLDPFAGSGAIPLERARMGAYQLIFASDADAEKVAALKNRLKDKRFERNRKTFFPKAMDAQDLSRFEDGLFTSIVTDPPWGDWESRSAEEITALYARFLREARRVISDEGRAVLLSGRNDSLRRALDANPDDWRVEEEYEVLISGKKARASLLLPVKKD